MQLHLDASAAKSIVERQGLSKVRHVDANVLWLQETCARKLIPLEKVAGEDNCSDVLPKNLTSAKLDENLTIMHIQSLSFSTRSSFCDCLVFCSFVRFYRFAVFVLYLSVDSLEFTLLFILNWRMPGRGCGKTFPG